MENSKAKRLIAMLTAIVFVLLASAVVAVVLNAEKQRHSNQEKIDVITYDYLPISVTDGVVSAYTGASDGTAHVEIPATYSLSETGLPVEGSDYQITKIQAEAFKDANFAFAKIDVSNVESIGESAFENAKNIYLAGGEQGYIIGANAFKNATVAFEHLVLREDIGAVPAVGADAFMGSKAFDAQSQIALLASNGANSNVVFADDIKTSGEIAPASSTGTGIITIADNAFKSNSSATSVNFSNFKGILKIGDSAFASASALGAVTLGTGITSIGNSSFNGSTISSFNCGGTINSLGTAVFWMCSSLKSADVSAGYNLTSLPTQTFMECANLTSIVGFGSWSKMTEIGANAFNDCPKMTTLDLSGCGNLKTIGEYAFKGGFTQLKLPSGVTTIGSRAFYTSKLTQINIPGTVTSIASNAFEGCTTLKTVSSYNYDPTGLVLETNANFTTVNWLPSSIETIGYSAFQQWTKLSSISLPSTVTSIESGAFAMCYDLSQIAISASIKTIGSSAFFNCGTLTKAISGTELMANTISIAPNNQNMTIVDWLPYSITEIGASTFEMWNNLTEVSLPLKLTKIGDNAFYSSALTGSLFIPSNVQSIGSGAFSMKESSSSELHIMNLEFGNSGSGTNTALQTIGASAFAYNNLFAVDLSKCTQLSSIGDYAFENCSSLSRVSIPLLSSIGKNAFSGCTSLTKTAQGSTLTANTISLATNTTMTTVDWLPSSITEIGANSFENWTKLTSIAISSTITTIGSNTFSGCTLLTKTTQGTTLTANTISLATNTEMTTVNWLPSSITEIGASSFDGWIALSSVAIPSTITTIGSNAFSGCRYLDKTAQGTTLTANTISLETNTNMTTVDWLPSSIDEIGGTSFSSWSKLSSVSLSDCTYLTTIGGGAFAMCSLLTKVSIPASVTTITSNAFYSCPLLTQTAQGSTLTAKTISLATNTKMTTVNWLPSSMETIGTNSFNGWTKLSSVTLPSNVTIIGSYAFKGCSALPTLTIPSSVRILGQYVFHTCSSLNKLTIPDSVREIDNNAFYQTGLKTACFGSTGTDTGYVYFAKSTNLATFSQYTLNGITKLTGSLSGYTSLKTFYLPRTLTKGDPGGVDNPSNVVWSYLFKGSSVESLRASSSSKWRLMKYIPYDQDYYDSTVASSISLKANEEFSKTYLNYMKTYVDNDTAYCLVRL